MSDFEDGDFRDDPTLGEILFSFEGRINRAIYWGYSLAITVAMMLFIGVGFAVSGDVGGGISAVIGVVAMGWSSLALNVKRCHDRNRSGWFVLVSAIPIVSIWYLIDIGFGAGTYGDNDYGPDPLG